MPVTTGIIICATVSYLIGIGMALYEQKKDPNRRFAEKQWELENGLIISNSLRS